jgi:hypothetical protein
MRGQTKNASQQATVNRLLAKGWREGDMFALAVPMYYDRPFVGLPRPHVIHVRRDGRCYRGYPGHSSVAGRNVAWGYQRSKK